MVFAKRSLQAVVTDAVCAESVAGVGLAPAHAHAKVCDAVLTLGDGGGRALGLARAVGG